MKKENKMNTTKLQALDNEALENVSGGVLTENSETYLNMKLTDYKKNCKTKQEVIEMLKADYANTGLDKMGVGLDEAEAYANEYYDNY